MEKIVLIGGGGHCKVIIDIIRACNRYEIVGICDFNIGESICNVPIIGSDDILEELHKNGVENAFLCIGAIGNPQKRIKIANKLKEIGFKLPSLIHPSAVVSEYANVGEGTCVMPNAVINADSDIGALSIINSSSVIEHDCCIGENVHISPRACLCGGVKVGENSHIGAGSVVNQMIIIGKNSIIGSGAVVIKDICDASKAVGVPAKKI